MMSERKRFVAIPTSKSFFLTDIKFWTDHEQELDEWCRTNFCVHQGMNVQALNEYGYLLFGLKWSE